MLKDTYQNEIEEEVSNKLRNLLNNIFENQKMDSILIYGNYYHDESTPYQICMEAKELNLLQKICDEYGIVWNYQDYKLDKETKKFKNSFFSFFKIDKKVLKKSMEITYLEYPHK